MATHDDGNKAADGHDAEVRADDHVDVLPDDLDAAGYVGPYTFPDNKRRRAPGALYIGSGVILSGLWFAQGDGVLVNRGFLVGGAALIAVGLYHLATSQPLKVDQTDALAAASRAVGFPVGHASAQQGWRGLRSRPTWKILLYSAENPPTSRGLVLVDGVDGAVVAHFVEDNPEDWSEYSTPESAGQAP